MQTYFSAASELHVKQMRALFTAYSNLLKKAPDDEAEQGETTELSRCLEQFNKCPLSIRRNAD